MDFTDKLLKLTEDENKSRLAKKFGLPSTAISNYISKRQMPRADKALILARALDVPLEWLVDDSQSWPPPVGIRPSAGSLSDTDLMREVCRRYRIEAVRLWDFLNRLEKVDWQRAASLAISVPIESPLPSEAADIVELAWKFHTTFFGLLNYNPESAASSFKGEIPGDDIPPAELTSEHLLRRIAALEKQTIGYRAIQEIAYFRHTPGGDRVAAEKHRQTLRDELKLQMQTATERQKNPGRYLPKN